MLAGLGFLLTKGSWDFVVVSQCALCPLVAQLSTTRGASPEPLQGPGAQPPWASHPVPLLKAFSCLYFCVLSIQRSLSPCPTECTDRLRTQLSQTPVTFHSHAALWKLLLERGLWAERPGLQAQHTNPPATLSFFPCHMGKMFPASG